MNRVTLVEFTVPGEPVGKQRPRAMPQAGRIHIYTPQKTTNYESQVRVFFSQAYPGFVPLNGELWFEVTAYLAIPRSKSLKKQREMEAGRIRPKCRPDISNILKISEDALNKIAFLDDALIVEETVGKWYSRTPKVVIRLGCFEEGGPR